MSKTQLANLTLFFLSTSVLLSFGCILAMRRCTQLEDINEELEQDVINRAKEDTK